MFLNMTEKLKITENKPAHMKIGFIELNKAEVYIIVGGHSPHIF